MCFVVEFGKYLVNECFDRGYTINTSKLQKLLYWAQKIRLSDTNDTLFKEKILAWECGPGIREIHNEMGEGILGFVDKYPIVLSPTKEDTSALQAALAVYGHRSSAELIELSKQENEWIEVYKNGAGLNKEIILLRPSDGECQQSEIEPFVGESNG